MSAIVKIFQTQNKRYRHVMSSDHDQVDLVDEDNATLLSFRDKDKVFDKRGRVGTLAVDFVDGTPHWTYYPMSGDIIQNLGPDLRAAAVQLSWRYIEQLGSVL